jgi:hypothetical protein
MPANRSHKGMGDDAEVNKESPKTKVDVSAADQGDTLTSSRTPRNNFVATVLGRAKPTSVLGATGRHLLVLGVSQFESGTDVDLAVLSPTPPIGQHSWRAGQ